MVTVYSSLYISQCIFFMGQSSSFPTWIKHLLILRQIILDLWVDWEYHKLANILLICFQFNYLILCMRCHTQHSTIMTIKVIHYHQYVNEWRLKIKTFCSNRLWFIVFHTKSNNNVEISPSRGVSVLLDLHKKRYFWACKPASYLSDPYWFCLINWPPATHQPLTTLFPDFNIQSVSNTRIGREGAWESKTGRGEGGHAYHQRPGMG